MSGFARFQGFPWKGVPGSDIARGTSLIGLEVDRNMASDRMLKNLSGSTADLRANTIARNDCDLVDSRRCLVRLGIIV